MAKIAKAILIYGSIFAASTGGAFMMQYKPSSSHSSSTPVVDDPIPEHVETPAEKLLGYLTGNDGINVNGNVSLNIENTQVNIDLTASVSLEDLENLSLSADLVIDVMDMSFEVSVTFIDGIITLDALDNHFKLETSTIMDFVNMLPALGIEIELPEDVLNIDIDELTNQLGSLTEGDKFEENGEYYFPFNILGLDLAIKTDADEQDRFLGARISPSSIMGIEISGDVNILSASKDELNIVNPLEGENASKYIDFKNAFNFVNHIVSLTKKDKLALNLKASVSNETINNIDIDLDLGIDLTSNLVSFNGQVNENNRTHNIFAAYLDETVYLNFQQVKVSIDNSTIANLLDYVFTKLGIDFDLEALISSISTSLGSIEVKELVNSIRGIVGSLTLSENELGITINLADYGVEMDPVSILISFNENGLSQIRLSELNINGTKVKVELSFLDYQEPLFNKAEYVAIDPLFGLIDTVEYLSTQTRFRVEMDALIDKQGTDKDVSMSGGVQFDLADMFGYGQLEIVDSDEYHHVIKGEMKNSDEFFFTYNNKLKGKFSSQTLIDMKDLAVSVIANPDKHFMELFADFLYKLQNSPLSLILGGDYGLLLEYELISNLSVTSTALECDLSLDILDMGLDSLHLVLHYEENAEGRLDIKGLTISELALGDSEVTVELRLKAFDETLESTRLNLNDTYLDFSDIKVLLEFGIETSKFEYYHISGNAVATVLGYDIKVPMDVKVRDENGKIKVHARLIKIPTIVGVNQKAFTSLDRSAELFYDGEYIYIDRFDDYLIAKNDVHYTKKCTTKYFIDNIVMILCDDILGLNDSILDDVEKSESSEKEQVQMKYEDIVQGFELIRGEEIDTFKFEISLFALTQDKMLKNNLKAKVTADSNTHILRGLHVDLDIALTSLITLPLSADFTLESDTSLELTDANKLYALEAYVAAHANDQLNVRLSYK